MNTRLSLIFSNDISKIGPMPVSINHPIPKVVGFPTNKMFSFVVGAYP